MEKQTTIVIAGGGYGGSVAAVLLSKYKRKYNLENLRVILIDRKDYHVHFSNLYEVATAEEEFTSLSQLKKGAVLPYKEFIPGNVEFLQAEISSIDLNQKIVIASGQTVGFDYLVLALGGEVEYFGIPGLKENAFTMKSVNDALKIRNAMEFLVESHRNDIDKRELRVIVGGGGAVGVELAGEMVNFISILGWKYGYPSEKIEIEVIEAAPQLLLGQPGHIARAALMRLKNIGVNTRLGSPIVSATDKNVSLKNGEVVNYDLLIWTGGAKSIAVPLAQKFQADRKQRCVTGEDLTIVGYENVFVIGDDACVMDDNKVPMPQTATQAIGQAEYVAAELIARMYGNATTKYIPQPSPFIFPVKGKWAIMYLPNGFSMTGFIPWLAKQFANVRYFMKLVGLGRAISIAWFQERIYSRND